MQDNRPAPTIRLATTADIPALMALNSRYYVGNLAESERSEGFLSMLLPADWFDDAIDGAGIHVATLDGDIVGFIGVTEPPSRDQVPDGTILAAILDLVGVVEFTGTPIAQQRFAIRGPVLVDESARGRGVYSGFNAVMRQAYRDRFDVGVLFVSADNPRSLHTTTTKLGAEPLADFEVAGHQYVLLAFEFSA